MMALPGFAGLQKVRTQTERQIKMDYLLFQGLTKIGSANYWNFATSPLVWSLELKLAPRFKMNELGEISSEI